MRIGDAMRLKPDSPLRERLQPFADQVGRVVETCQDDDDRLRITMPDLSCSTAEERAAVDRVVARLRPMSAKATSEAGTAASEPHRREDRRSTVPSGAVAR